MNRINQLFQHKHERVLSVFSTAGFPQLNSLPQVLQALQDNGVDLVEIGMPFSDPTADGPTIQHSNTIAIRNGMTLEVLFAQLKDIRQTIHLPLILMGYVNPVLQFGIERFLEQAAAVGIDGIIIPDLPMYEFESMYAPAFKKHGLGNIFLITPQTSEDRIRKVDAITDSFIYAVSTNSITGGQLDFNEQQAAYFGKLKAMDLKNPVLAGFGIRDKQTFDFASGYLNGAIIGSAFVKAIEQSTDLAADIRSFIQSVRG